VPGITPTPIPAGANVPVSIVPADPTNYQVIGGIASTYVSASTGITTTIGRRLSDYVRTSLGVTASTVQASASVPAAFGAGATIHLVQKPAMNKTQVVFSYAGDLWMVSRQGGVATRLTAGAGVETEPAFSPDGNTLAFTVELGLIALAMTLLMTAGEFDLSVGSVFAIMPMSIALMLNAGAPFWPAFAVGVLICAIIGFLNAFITLRFDIPSFITTLGMLFMVRSLTIVMSGGFPPLLAVDKVPMALFIDFIGGGLFRASFLWFVALVLLASAIMSRTNFGNWISATGGFIEAARSMGIPVTRVKFTCFMMCSILAGLAGTVQVFRLKSPFPNLGETLELQAIAGSVIGGVALTGGVGTVFGAVVGALLIRVIDNGLVLSRIDANWFKFAIGALTVFAVVCNSWLRRTARRIKLEV